MRKMKFKEVKEGTSLVVQWLRLHDPNAGGPGLIPGQGTRSHILQLKILHAATKTCCSQIKKESIAKIISSRAWTQI